MSQKGRVISAVYGKQNDAGRVVGQSLKSLREAVGYTQCQMAEKLGVGQSTISKIEESGDVKISSLRRYVEALGACLRIEAAFCENSLVSASLHDVPRIDESPSRQFVLPIFVGDELCREIAKDIVISIHPRYSEKILEGKKTVELRRKFPVSIAKGTRIYIYSTSPVMAVVGVAEVSNVIKLPVNSIWEKYSRSAFIKRKDFDGYFKGVVDGVAVELMNVQAFNRPVSLLQLRSRFNFTPPQSFIYASKDFLRVLMDEQSNISN